MHHLKFLTAALSCSFAFLVSTPVFASATNGTIDTTNRYAWSENGGWIDFGSTEGAVGVSDSGLTGYAWSENFGWISLSCSNSSTCATVDYGVTNNGNGTLGGYAWSENFGWIDFDPTYGGVTISSSGVFSGYAWGENIGWIVFNCSNESSCGTVNYTISTDWRPSSARTSASTSTTTQRSGGTRAETLQNRIAGARTPIARNAAPASAPDLTAEDQQEALRQRAVLEQKLYVNVNGIMMMYSDVPLSAWFTPYVTKLIEWGIAEGYRDARGELTGLFGVAKPVTRAEVLKMSLRIAGTVQSVDASPKNTSAQGTWASSYVAEAEKMGLSVFTKATDVHAPATRGEVVQIILEALQRPLDSKTLADFSDVPSNSPFAAAIATAFDLKIIQGDTDGEGNLLKTFRPNDPINRAEVAKIMSLAKELVAH